ncbi:MAG TPA: ATP-dependent sacrificial sulfur transferase LarE [Candidatus Ozemobacteraceae bacterium]|nr:ATP-dependent sacrificial sulfur transferase LarE [Candidatus Ozemobacteraceae bacterium]
MADKKQVCSQIPPLMACTTAPSAPLSVEAVQALDKLEQRLSLLNGLVVAYSGGMDSGFLALTARRILGTRMKAVFLQTAFIAEADGERARALAHQFNLPLTILTADVLAEPALRANPDNRCYLCKQLVIKHLRTEVPPGWELGEGSVTDDAGDYRPGKQALREAGVLSPLDAAGFSKSLVRECLMAMNAGEFVRPSQSCLATRIPAGQAVNEERLRRIDRGEAFLAGLGLSNLRLRDHDGLVRLECPPEQWSLIIEHRAEILQNLQSLGFTHITLDLGGYRRGSTNRIQPAGNPHP